MSAPSPSNPSTSPVPPDAARVQKTVEELLADTGDALSELRDAETLESITSDGWETQAQGVDTRLVQMLRGAADALPQRVREAGEALAQKLCEAGEALAQKLCEAEDLAKPLLPRLRALHLGKPVERLWGSSPSANDAILDTAMRVNTRLVFFGGETEDAIPTEQDFERDAARLRSLMLQEFAVLAAAGPDRQQEAEPPADGAPESFLDFPRKQRLLLMTLRGQGKVPIDAVLRAVWGDNLPSAPEDTLHKLKTRTNGRLAVGNHNLEIRREGKTLKLAPV